MSVPLAWSSPAVQAGAIALAVVAVALLAVFGYRRWKNSRITPEEKERRRRDMLVAHGKIGDAQLVDVSQSLLVFTYTVRGMEYTASQDISLLGDKLPEDLSSIGPVAIKYMPTNPANSIVLADLWSGLHLETKRRSQRK